MMHRHVISGKSGNFDWRPFRLAGLLRTAKAVRLVIFLASVIAVRTHRTVTAVVVRVSCVGLVDRQSHVIRAQPVAMRIAVGEQAALQYLVGGGTDARQEVCGIEGRLFY